MDAFVPNPDELNQEQKQAQTITNSKVFSKTFLYFGLALLITGVVSILGGMLFNYINNPTLYIVMTTVSSIGIFALSLTISFKGFQMGNGLIVPYILYSVFMGLLLSGCSTWVGSPYIFGLVVCITSAIFMLMCGIGYLIGDKIGILGTLLIGATIGAGILGLVSFFAFPFMFTGSMEAFIPMFWIGEFLFLGIFMLYIAFDMYALKQVADSNALISTNVCIFFALRLYSDFISLLVRILRIVAIFLANSNSDN